MTSVYSSCIQSDTVTVTISHNYKLTARIKHITNRESKSHVKGLTCTLSSKTSTRAPSSGQSNSHTTSHCRYYKVFFRSQNCEFLLGKAEISPPEGSEEGNTARDQRPWGGVGRGGHFDERKSRYMSGEFWGLSS